MSTPQENTSQPRVGSKRKRNTPKKYWDTPDEESERWAEDDDFRFIEATYCHYDGSLGSWKKVIASLRNYQHRLVGQKSIKELKDHFKYLLRDTSYWFRNFSYPQPHYGMVPKNDGSGSKRRCNAEERAKIEYQWAEKRQYYAKRHAQGQKMLTEVKDRRKKYEIKSDTDAKVTDEEEIHTLLCEQGEARKKRRHEIKNKAFDLAQVETKYNDKVVDMYEKLYDAYLEGQRKEEQREKVDAQLQGQLQALLTHLLEQQMAGQQFARENSNDDSERELKPKRKK